jgi:hypothetical protein
LRETCRKDPAQLRAAAGPAFTDARPRPAGSQDTPRASLPAIAASCTLPTMPCDGTTGTSGTAAMCNPSRAGEDSHPRIMRGCPCPVAHDGASVQPFYGTVIIIRVIYNDINFVVEMSDKVGVPPTSPPYRQGGGTPPEKLLVGGRYPPPPYPSMSNLNLIAHQNIQAAREYRRSIRFPLLPGNGKHAVRAKAKGGRYPPTSPHAGRGGGTPSGKQGDGSGMEWLTRDGMGIGKPREKQSECNQYKKYKNLISETKNPNTSRVPWIT